MKARTAFLEITERKGVLEATIRIYEADTGALLVEKRYEGLKGITIGERITITPGVYRKECILALSGLSGIIEERGLLKISLGD